MNDDEQQAEPRLQLVLKTAQSEGRRETVDAARQSYAKLAVIKRVVGLEGFARSCSKGWCALIAKAKGRMVLC